MILIKAKFSELKNGTPFRPAPGGGPWWMKVDSKTCQRSDGKRYDVPSPDELVFVERCILVGGSKIPIARSADKSASTGDTE